MRSLHQSNRTNGFSFYGATPAHERLIAVKQVLSDRIPTKRRIHVCIVRTVKRKFVCLIEIFNLRT